MRSWRVLGVAGLVLTSACAPAINPRTGGPAVVSSVANTALQVPQASGGEMRVVASEFKFDTTTLHASVGQPVTLVLDNRGTIQHNLQVEGQDLKVVASAGHTASTAFTFDTPGEYTFACSIPGHKQAGMQGKLVVDQPGAAAHNHAASTTTATTSTAPLTSFSATTSTTTTPVTTTQPVPAGTTRLPQPQVAPPVTRREPALVKVELETKEVTALMADGIAYQYWTFSGTVPGPMIRVRQGDTVDLHLANAPGTQATHSINLHAVSGPGGGAWATQTEPGADGGIRFKATRPGVYVYHCMTPPVGQHVANGMYGMIIVEPPEGLAPVDHEWYVMEGDFYVQGDANLPGLREFSMDKLLAERPDYVVFNGSVGALAGDQALRAHVGETVRIFFGVGGPALDSAFHVVGGIFDKLYPEGASEFLTNVQTTLVPPGDAVMAELKFDAPGHYMIEDHHITRLQKGAMAEIEVDGPEQPDIFQATSKG